MAGSGGLRSCKWLLHLVGLSFSSTAPSSATMMSATGTRLFRSHRVIRPPIHAQLYYSTGLLDGKSITIGDQSYEIDHMSNLPTSIITKLNRNLYQDVNHPMGILKDLIYSKLSSKFKKLYFNSPVVTPFQNFDQLGFPSNHPGRSKSDSYYLNSKFMLRTHTSAHEVESFKTGQDHWLITADVYRRDEIDSYHFPVFHQMEGASVVDRTNVEEFNTSTMELEYKLCHQNIQIQDPTDLMGDHQQNPYQVSHDPSQVKIVIKNLRATINSLIFDLFGHHQLDSNEPLLVRWIPAYFPFTSPSYEVEVFYNGKWLEILGCGVIQQKTLEEANVPSKIGWAFGLGLERIAMVLFSIPDIRLFWSTDKRFKDQFTSLSGEKESKLVLKKFQPFSSHPSCYKDISFWIPDQNNLVDNDKGASFESNDFFEIIRDVGGNLIEEVKLIDEFTHPTTHRKSQCYRIVYRSLERNLSNEEVNQTQASVRENLQAKLGLEFR